MNQKTKALKVAKKMTPEQKDRLFWKNAEKSSSYAPNPNRKLGKPKYL